MAELSQPTTFNLTAGAYVQGSFSSLRIVTTVQQALTPLPRRAASLPPKASPSPTLSRTAGYVLYGLATTPCPIARGLVATNQDELRHGGVCADCWGARGGILLATADRWGGTGTIHLPMAAVSFPTTDPALLDNSGTNARLLFDNATRQCAYWGPFRMNADYMNTPVFKFQYAMTSVLTGGVSIDVEVMTVPAGDAASVHTESYATVNNCADAAVPATTAGRIDEISCSLTNNDGLAAGRFTKIRVCRAVADAVDMPLA